MLFAALLPAVNAQDPEAPIWDVIEPRLTGVTSDGNLTYLLGAQIMSMGNSTNITVVVFVVAEADVIASLGYYPTSEQEILDTIFLMIWLGWPTYVAQNTTVNSLPYTQPTPSNVTVNGILPPSTRFFQVTAIEQNRSGTNYEYVRATLFETIDYDTAALITSHPLAPHIQSLGLPVTPTLALIGLIILLAPMLLVTRLSKHDVSLLPLMLMGLTASAFLRFWPPITVIFVGLLAGWMVTKVLTGGIAWISSPTSHHI